MTAHRAPSIWDPEVDFGTPGGRSDARPCRSPSTAARSTSPPARRCCAPPTEAGVDDPQAVRDRLARRRSAPAGCAWSRSTAARACPPRARRRAPTAWSSAPRPSTVRELRRNVMELYLSDHPEDCDGCARGNCEIQAMAAHGRLRRGALRPARVARAGRPPAADRPEQPLLRLRRLLVHRLLPLRARLRRHPGHLRAHRRGPRLRLQDQRRRHRLHVLRVRLVRRLRAGLPDVRAARSTPSSSSACRPARSRPPAPTAASAARSAPRSRARATTHGRADDPVEERRRQRGPQLRQGPLRLRLRRPQGPPALPDGARHDRRRVAHGLVGRGDRQGRRGLPGHPGRARRRLDRRHLLQPLHQRGGLRRPEDGAGGVRQQQHRHLRAGVPLAHRLRPQADLRHLRRHPGLPLGRPGRRDPADRRQPDRRPPGLRLADEEAAARGRPADRGRPAPDRPGPQPARRGGATTCPCCPAPTSPSSTRWPT